MEDTFKIGYSMPKTPFDSDLYTRMALWCNENNHTIAENEDSYVVTNVKIEIKENPTVNERIAVLEDAVNTLLEGVSTTNG